MRAQVDRISYAEVRELIRQLELDANEQNTMSNCIILSDQLFVGTFEGRLACVYGLAPPTLVSSSAYLWLYCTELVEQNKFIFVRHSQRVVEELLKEYPRIVGHCAIDNERAKRWVKWLGGKFGNHEGRRVPFVIERG